VSDIVEQLRHFTELETGYTPLAFMCRAADEIQTLRTQLAYVTR
jgi:hypothetical protein